MAEFTEVEVLRVYCGESDRADGRPVYEVVVEEARRHGAAGATVLRGVLGFGAGSLVHTAKILRLSEDLPMVVEIVDRPERVEALLPRIQAVTKGGLITRQRLSAHFHCPVRVRDVMAADTRGVGRLILAALDDGARRFVIGLGGSATNDGGAGMLAELGEGAA